jgi:signal transduction histidine kinase
MLYRHIVPATRNGEPVLIPTGYVLALAVHPAAALAADLEAVEGRLAWTLGLVAFVVILGMLFLWRALRAETRLATRKADFVNAVSHELRTPLTSIRMYADMLKEGWIKDEQTAQDYFALISAESERLARLVNNVLDFSRIEKGKKSFRMQVGDPAPVVRDVAEVLRPYLKDKGFELALDVPESLPACSFDKDALTQILVNLIDNAVKYGETEVRVEAEALDGDIVLRVLDRGPGVPDDEREKIFDPFQRGRDVAGGGGSGLGLALVKHYAAAHRGRIEVGEREGGGAVFALHIPRG